jgi:hypothetical protein
VALADAGGGATYVSDRVVVAALRSALGDLDGLAPSRIRVEVADDRCTADEVELVARYGTDLQLLGDRCHEIVTGVLRGLLLAAADAVEVSVVVVDVTLDDPQR